MNTPSFDPIRLIDALSDGGVAFVVIGGVAGRVHGSPTVTRDLDICPATGGDNLNRLAGVLVELHARLRGVDDDVPFILDGRTLRSGANFTFTTDAGDLDVLASPSGVTGYDELAAGAARVDLGNRTVLVTGLDDLVTMKRAAGRPKDRIELEILAAIREERDRH